MQKASFVGESSWVRDECRCLNSSKYYMSENYGVFKTQWLMLLATQLVLGIGHFFGVVCSGVRETLWFGLK